MELKIREATSEDLVEIMRLIGQPDMSPENRLTKDQANELFKKISNSPFHKLYVAESNASIVGTFALITIQQLSHNGACSMIIEDIVVDSKLQGQGVGHQIMSFATEQAKASGAYKICLSSGLARLKAHEFYEKLGYKQDGHRFALRF